MNIIEAIQKAEQGKLITNNFLKIAGKFLVYNKRGVFYEFQNLGSYAIYIDTHLSFSFSDIISIGWEIIENDFEFDETSMEVEFNNGKKCIINSGESIHVNNLEREFGSSILKIQPKPHICFISYK